MSEYVSLTSESPKVLIDRAQSVVESALEAAAKAYAQNIDVGAAQYRTNQFGEQALLMDIRLEEAVIEVLRKSKLPLRVVSEEHGTVDLADSPQMLAVLDGLDGSSEYLINRGLGRYGTMLMIASSISPNFDDYLSCGIVEHAPSSRSLIAAKGSGALVLDDGNSIRAVCKANCELGKATKTYSTWSNHPRFAQCARLPVEKIISVKSMESAYFDLAQGKAELMLDYTRKGNLEQMVGFGILKEAGGAILLQSGESLGQERYMEFGRDSVNPMPLIAASSKELAEKVILACNF